jgi:hypothetical protein
MARRWWMVDLLVVLLFVGIGRSTHHHLVDVAGMVSTTWPFAVGLATGWIVVVCRRQNGATLGAGIEAWLATVVVGMIVRVLVGQGTAFAFILVALGFLGALMLGLRVVRRVLERN